MIWMIVIALFELTVSVCALTLRLTFFIMKGTFYLCFLLPLRLLSALT